MLFQTLGFFVFLAFVCPLYWALPRLRLWVLALANALFYLAAGWANLGLFLVASALTYALGRRVTGPGGKAWLALGIALNLANLMYFKYAGFVASMLPFDAPWLRDVLLPIGISFYTFQHISYMVDRRLRGLPSAPNYLHFWVYISFFGHSIAGPIMRGHELFPQLAGVGAQRHDAGQLRHGLGLFALGMVKKVAIATPLAAVVDMYFASPGLLSTGEAWVAAVLFAFQIYYDFSAYSDMAVGIGLMFGLVLTQNFLTPYVAESPAAFWQRWHITLSHWIRDYVYIPLGGNRGSSARARLNLFLALVLSGLWHGANWTFLAWGAYHGSWLVIERTQAWGRLARALPKFVALPLTFVLVMFGWVLFRAESLANAAHYFGRLLSWHPLDSPDALYSWGELLPHRVIFFGSVGLSGCVLMAWPRAEAFVAWMIGKRRGPSESLGIELARFAFALSSFTLSVFSLVNSKFNPFIYFRF